MRIFVATDAWHPQVNGVVRTLATVRDELQAMGHQVEIVGPDRFRTIPCPTYPEIRLSLLPGRRLARLIDGFAPDAIHIATEGPLGLAARRYCLKRRLPFTTAYHTRFPEYVRARLFFPLAATYAILRRFHARSAGVMVATRSIRAELEARGFARISDWTRGVDLALFHPGKRRDFGWQAPVFAFVGRVAVEKNIEAFLDLDLPGTKLVVGDGPLLDSLKRRYPDAVFAGAHKGEELAARFASADVFVFPSRTDTFGLVMLEAMACGLPVAAYPVPGPLDVVTDAKAGVLNEDLRQAALDALSLKREHARAHAETYSWRRTAEMFLANLALFKRKAFGDKGTSANYAPLPLAGEGGQSPGEGVLR
ncbi:MAG: glycosyltransferase family 4 protein [Reyranellaceae bacterium]